MIVAQHDLPKPSTNFGHAIMFPALKLDLDGLELRNHSLFRSDPTYMRTRPRLIEFGRFAARDRKLRGERKPETFTFLGFTHYCGQRHKNGTFTVVAYLQIVPLHGCRV